MYNIALGSYETGYNYVTRAQKPQLTKRSVNFILKCIFLVEKVCIDFMCRWSYNTLIRTINRISILKKARFCVFIVSQLTFKKKVLPTNCGLLWGTSCSKQRVACLVGIYRAGYFNPIQSELTYLKTVELFQYKLLQNVRGTNFWHKTFQSGNNTRYFGCCLVKLQQVTMHGSIYQPDKSCVKSLFL